MQLGYKPWKEPRNLQKTAKNARNCQFHTLSFYTICFTLSLYDTFFCGKENRQSSTKTFLAAQHLFWENFHFFIQQVP